jgi:lysyl-tRNA synthetase class 1
LNPNSKVYSTHNPSPPLETPLSFDLDVIKIYEDYDKCERIFFGIETVNEKKGGKGKADI